MNDSCSPIRITSGGKIKAHQVARTTGTTTNPSQAWEVASLYFTEGLSPHAKRHNNILVVIDKFLVSMDTSYISPLHLQHYNLLIYFNNVNKLHVLPKTMILNQYRVFTNTVWQEFFKFSDTKLVMSSYYYP